MITFDIGSRRFSPTWLSTLLVLLVVPLILSLAKWQYGRAQEKIDLRQQVEQRINRPAVEFSEVSGDLENNRFQTIRIRGSYDTERQFLLDNQTREWQFGYSIITPFTLESGEILLVNRGWVTQPPSRDVLPDLTISQPNQTIQGKVDLPGRAVGLGEISQESGWPLRLQRLDYEAIAKVLDKPVEPMILMLSEAAADGYDRAWQPALVGPMKHYGYMFQWLAMAAAVLVLYVLMNLKKNGHEK